MALAHLWIWLNYRFCLAMVLSELWLQFSSGFDSDMSKAQYEFSLAMASAQLWFCLCYELCSTMDLA